MKTYTRFFPNCCACLLVDSDADALAKSQADVLLGSVPELGHPEDVLPRHQVQQEQHRATSQVVLEFQVNKNNKRVNIDAFRNDDIIKTSWLPGDSIRYNRGFPPFFLRIFGGGLPLKIFYPYSRKFKYKNLSFRVRGELLLVAASRTRRRVISK